MLQLCHPKKKENSKISSGYMFANDYQMNSKYEVTQLRVLCRGSGQHRLVGIAQFFRSGLGLMVSRALLARLMSAHSTAILNGEIISRRQDVTGNVFATALFRAPWD